MQPTEEEVSETTEPHTKRTDNQKTYAENNQTNGLARELRKANLSNNPKHVHIRNIYAAPWRRQKRKSVRTTPKKQCIVVPQSPDATPPFTQATPTTTQNTNPSQRSIRNHLVHQHASDQPPSTTAARHENPPNPSARGVPPTNSDNKRRKTDNRLGDIRRFFNTTTTPTTENSSNHSNNTPPAEKSPTHRTPHHNKKIKHYTNT